MQSHSTRIRCLHLALQLKSSKVKGCHIEIWAQPKNQQMRFRPTSCTPLAYMGTPLTTKKKLSPSSSFCRRNSTSLRPMRRVITVACRLPYRLYSSPVLLLLSPRLLPSQPCVTLPAHCCDAVTGSDLPCAALQLLGCISRAVLLQWCADPGCWAPRHDVGATLMVKVYMICLPYPTGHHRSYGPVKSICTHKCTVLLLRMRYTMRLHVSITPGICTKPSQHE